MCDQLEDNWEEQTVENFEGIAKGIISSLGMIENVRQFFFYFLVYGSSDPNFCILEKK